MNGGALTTLDRLALGGAAAIAAASAIVWIATGNLGSRPLEVAFGAIAAGSHLIWWTVGAVIVVRARGHRIGWLLVLASTFGAVAMGSWALAGGNAGPEASPVAAWAFLLVTATYGPWFVTLILAGMLLFPDGRLPGRRWRIPASLIVGAVVVSTISRIVAPGPLFAGLPDNPLGIELLRGAPLDALAVLVPLGIAAFAVLGAVSLVVRIRRGGTEVRHQLKWLLVAVVPVALTTPFSFFEADQTTTSLADLIQVTAMLLLMPASIGIAITRYRLYEIDRLISRGLAWGVLTGLLVAVYAGAVLVLQGLLGGVTQGETLAVAASTLLAAALFQPLRGRVQRAMDRRFDRARYDGERAAAAFAERLRDEIDLDTLAAEVLRVADETVRPDSSAVWLRIIADPQKLPVS